MEHTVRYRYRLRVSPSQERELQAVFDSCRFVWNTALGRWNDLWQHEQTPLSYRDMSAELTDWRSRYEWLRRISRVPQEQTLRDLDRSVRAFYDKGNPAGRPRFKKKGHYATGNWHGNTFIVRAGRLELVCNSRIALRVVWSRPLPSTPKSVRVWRDPAGRWWASFVVRVPIADGPLTGRATGLDVGLKVFATTEHEEIPNPRYARQAAKALARSQRNMARKQKGSKNRAKARRQTAKIYARVANQRHDFAHKQARELTRSYDVIGVEDLRVRNMLRNRSLSRAISDAGWREFLTLLEWHAAKCGHQVVRIDPRNTSQTCSGCGAKATRKLTLRDRTFVCESCGLILDRDRNAARNLNPNRRGRTGAGVDGSKTTEPAGTLAA